MFRWIWNRYRLLLSLCLPVFLFLSVCRFPIFLYLFLYRIFFSLLLLFSLYFCFSLFLFISVRFFTSFFVSLFLSVFLIFLSFHSSYPRHDIIHVLLMCSVLSHGGDVNCKCTLQRSRFSAKLTHLVSRLQTW